MAGEIRNKKIVILGTGGTIAGTAAQAGDNLGYTAAQVGPKVYIGNIFNRYGGATFIYPNRYIFNI